MAPHRFFEDFTPGTRSVHGPISIDQAAIIAFAKEFDPQPFHVDEAAARESFVGELIASGWHSCALVMRLLADNILHDAASMGAPGIEEVRWLHPVRPGDSVRLRASVLEALRSQKRPGMGRVRFRFELIGADDTILLDQTNWIMFGTREAAQTAAPIRYGNGPSRTGGAGSGPGTPDRTGGDHPPENAQAAPPMPFFEDLAVGEEAELGSYAFTPDNIVAFARQFDPQPFHLDEQAARESAFGGLCASGWHTGAAWMKCMVGHRNRGREAARSAGLPVPDFGPSPGFTNLVWRRPVYAGDVIRYRSRITDKRPSRSRPGWGLAFSHNSGINAAGETVFAFDGCVFWRARG
ncbi:MAG: MaoC family dehydratase [Salinarimonas sp.]|nr:MaoC family dehydratase [Salinarimonas sp.]